MTKDNEINKILVRAEKYRKQLHSTETTPQSSSSEDNLEFEKIFWYRNKECDSVFSEFAEFGDERLFST